MLLHYSFSSNEFMAYEVMKKNYIIKGKSINVEFFSAPLIRYSYNYFGYY